MRITKKFSNFTKTFLAIVVFQFGVIATAQAGLIITSETTFDDGFSIGMTSGSFTDTSGGVFTSSAFSDSSADTTPLIGNWSLAGDGVTYDGATTSNVSNDYFAIGIDTSIGIENTHATDIFQVVFEFMFNNQVEASGIDAFSDSEFTIFEGANEEYFTDIISDTANGNQGGAGGIGGVVSETATVDFSYTLNPGETINLALALTIEGEDFAGGFVNADFDQSFKIKSLTNLSNTTPNDVPEPSTLLILFSALAILIRRKL